ncbi:MAG: FecR domain-containing protein [Anaerolineae bacterium]
MKSLQSYAVIIISLCCLMIGFSVTAQNEFAASLDVLNAGVEVQRVNTNRFITVEIEAIVGVGDIIRTDDTGEARITFFADGTDVTLEPATEYRIVEFDGDDEDFRLTVDVIAGQATHRLNRTLGANSRYDVETPGMTLAAQGTTFAIRVEDTGRSSMLVFEGLVDAGAEADSANVSVGFGVRSAVDAELSDVVRADTFAQLDSALDGCPVTVTTVDDVSINVRSAPSLDAPQIGVILASDIDRFYGVNTSGNWYRVVYESEFGWILSSNATLETDCAGLRLFEDSFAENQEVLPDAPDAESTEQAESYTSCHP